MADPSRACGTFLYVTTAETKTGVLLIETFRTLFSPQSDGHLGLSLVAFLAHPIRHIIIDICAVDLSWNRKNKPFRAAYFVTWNKL